MDHSEALSALDAKRQAEVQMAKAATCPPWRHALFGFLMAALVVSPAFDFPVRMLILILILCSIPVIVQSDRKRMGMFINGYRRGKTRIVALGVLGVELSLYLFSVIRAFDHHDHFTPWLLGVVGLLVGVAGSMLWQRVFVREMGS